MHTKHSGYIQHKIQFSETGDVLSVDEEVEQVASQ